MLPRRLARDPLLHFLAAGGLLFLVFRLIEGPAAAGVGDKTIVVDRPALLRFMQYQSAAFEPKYFSARLDAMSAKQRQDLVDQYVREEALFREAGALGLADGDYVIRRRMVQKMLYLIDDATTESFSPDRATLERYFESNRQRYEIAPSITFTHVFVDRQLARSESPLEVAKRLKRELEAKGAGFEDAPRYGDRFPYLQNYVDRSPDYIESQFGAEFTAALLRLEPSAHAWRGPIESPYGYHLILLTQHKPARLPKLSEIVDQVKDDLLRDTLRARRERAVADLVGEFEVKVEPLK